MVATQVNGSVSYIQAHKKYNWTIAPSTLGLKGDGLIHLYANRSQVVINESQSQLHHVNSPLSPVHMVRFFLITTAVLLMAIIGLYGIQCKCTHSAILTTTLNDI